MMFAKLESDKPWTRWAGPIVLLCCAVLMMWSAGPARASIVYVTEIEGITEGQLATGQLHLRANVVGRPDLVLYELSGPVQRVYARRGLSPAMAVDPQTGRQIPWDISTFPEGDYRLRVTAVLKDGADHVTTARFTIRHTSTDTEQNDIIIDVDDSDPSAEDDGERAAPTPQVVVVGGASNDAGPVTVLDNLQSARELPTVRFRDQPDSYTRGSGGVLRVGMSGAMPADADIIVIAWSNAESRIIDAFAHELDLDDPAIRGDRLDLLPPGDTQLQLLVRHASQIHQIVRLNLDIIVRDPVASALPEVGFIDPPSAYERGSGEAIRISLAQAMPEGGDILALAWSKEEQRMVEEFAFVVGDDLMIPAQALDSLPAGGIQLQLLARLNNAVQQRVSHVLDVHEPVVPEPVAQTPLPSVGFAAPPATYHVDSGQDVAVTVGGPMPENADIVVVAWSDSQQGMVSDFSFTMIEGDWRIPADRMQRLPLGRVELQLLLRRDNTVLSVTSHQLEMAPPTQVVLPSPDPELRPAVTFGRVPAMYVLGSGQSLAIQSTGDFPEGTDLLVIAWSVDQSRLVDAFAFTLTEGPYEIPAQRMDLLPAGEVILQLMPREDNAAYAQVVHQMTIVEHHTGNESGAGDVLANNAEPGNDGEPILETDTDDGADAEAVAEGQAGDDTMPEETVAEGQGEAGDDAAAQGDSGAAPMPDAIDVAFASGASNTHLRGSDTSLPLAFSAPLPSGASVRVQAWSIDLGQYVSLFSQTLQEGPWAIASTQLDLLPDGSYRIEVALLVPGQPEAQVQHLLVIASPDEDGQGAAQGFTIQTPSEDTKQVYVSATSGDDNNDGLSPQTPVRTVERGYALLRDGHPDWLLLRRGEVFELAPEGGDFRRWNRSGRSEQEPMLMGAYGPEGQARPILHSNGDGIFRSLRADHVVFRDLHMRANRRDPHSDVYDPELNNEVGIWISSGNDLRFEGCLIELFRINVSMLDYPEPEEPTIRDIQFYRCVIRDAYSHGESDSSGMFCKFVSGLTITESLLDHNGWHEDVSDSHRRGRNHNAYFSHCFDVHLVGNVIARGSYEDIKFRSEDSVRPSTGLRVVDNLFLACAYPMGFDTNNDDPNAPIVYSDVRVTGNVFACTIGWPLDNPGGPMVRMGYMENGVASGNIFCDPDPRNLRPRAIQIKIDSDLSDVIVTDNTAVLGFDVAVYGFPFDEVSDELLLANNPFEMPEHFYVDAHRTMASYIEGVEGVSSVDAYLDALGKQRLGQWSDALRTHHVVDYFVRGFERAPFD